jgi:methylmalonyl-CoA carboxyltransferase small subunit
LSPDTQKGAVSNDTHGGGSVCGQVGQQIRVNDILLVLEAMKMETQITAPIAGKVAKINANVGDSVQAKQVLIELE